jgi:NADPH2:quinone reductase
MDQPALCRRIAVKEIPMTKAAPPTMRALIGGHGPCWRLEHVNLPTVPPGVVRVRVVAAGINRADLYKLDGTYGVAPTTGSFGAGMEFAGIVETEDPGSPHLPVGAPVMGVTVGAFADYALCLPGLLLPIPTGISFAEAAALPTGLITEHDALVTQAGLTAGQSVLIVGGTTAVGLVAIQLANALGAATVIGTTTSERKRRVMADAGAHVTVNTSDETLADAVLQATNGQGVDITIDHIGGDLFTDLPAATRIGGVIVNVGRLGGANVTLNLDELSFRRQRLYGTTFGVRTPDEMARVFAALQPDVTNAVADGRIIAPIDHTYLPEDFQAAADRMRANQTLGKIIFAFGDDDLQAQTH